MNNKSLIVIVSVFLFTLMSLGANIDARPLKTQTLMENSFRSHIEDNSAKMTTDMKAIIDIR